MKKMRQTTSARHAAIRPRAVSVKICTASCEPPTPRTTRLAAADTRTARSSSAAVVNSTMPR